MEMRLEQHSSSASSSTSTAEHGGAAPSLWPPKRPAGRTKFRETRHPVFRGVRRRGSAGRWVCEVRVPGVRGTRLWLGSYVAADAAARAHDAAMLMIRGRTAACLNFLDSAWLLAVPPAFASLADVRGAAVQAVADFQRRTEAASASTATAAGIKEEVTSRVSAPSSAACSARSSETLADPDFEAPPAALDSAVFDLDYLFGETEFDTNYYASLAQGLLMDPPAAGEYSWAWDNGECGDGGGGAGTDVALWSY